jgi:UPF0716 family protein affecting phage T7 exclusion
MITPGLLTDTFGLALLVPPIRALCKRRIGDWVRARSVVQVTAYAAGSSGEAAPYQDVRSETVMDAEFTRHPSDADA